MEARNIVVIGTLDTTGEQILLLKDRIAKKGHKVILVDLSVGRTFVPG